MSYKPTIAVVGVNGFLGFDVLKAMLSDTFKASYALPIRVVTRDFSKIKAKLGDVTDADIKAYQADLQTGEGLAEAFEGANVVVNLLGFGFSHDKVAEAAAAAAGTSQALPAL